MGSTERGEMYVKVSLVSAEGVEDRGGGGWNGGS